MASGSNFKFGKIQTSKNDITSAGGTTVLTNSSDYIQYVTGSSAQTIQLPDATTMVVAMGFLIVNANSAGNVTITNNGSSTLATLKPGQSLEIIVDSVSTSNGVWMLIQGGGAGSLTWTDVTGTSQSLAAGNGYVADNASQVTFTLPATTAVGDTYYIVGRGAGGWKVAQNAGQVIYDDTSASGTGTAGYISSGTNRSCVALVCTVASTEFQVINFNGSVVVFSGPSTGYSAGGNSSTSAIRNLVFASETSSTLTATLSSAKYQGTAVSGPAVSGKGYYAGSSAPTTTIDAFVFSSQTCGSIAAVLSTARSTACGFQSTTNGYFAGGNAPSNSTTSIEKILFSSDTQGSVSATLNTALTGSCGVSSSAKGYLMGGIAYPASTGSNIVQALTFSGETTATISATLASATYNATQNTFSSTKGYMMGGENPSSTNAVLSLTFSGETTATVSATLSETKYFNSGVSSLSKCYTMGGQNGSPFSSKIEGLTFSGEAIATLSATIGTALCEAEGFQG